MGMDLVYVASGHLSERWRGRWVLEAAMACGRLAGSLRNRVMYV